MIELEMVRRMIRKGLILAPFIIGALGAYGGIRWGVSAAIGLGMTLGNLYLAGRMIGSIAERQPQLLLAAALTAFTVGLMALTGVALILRALDLVYFPVTGLVLVSSHLALVLWEAPAAYDRIPKNSSVALTDAVQTRS